MKKLLFISLILLNITSVFAQDIEVKKFEPMEKDQTAALSPRKDINGTVCGLVKVQLKETGLLFQGNIVGDVEATGTEYYVYLAKGCKRINIKHPDYLPTTVVFSDYGVTKIESGKTYLLELKAEKAVRKATSKKQGVLVLTIKPSDADLYVDDELIPRDNSGVYTLNLSQGNHYYTVQKGAFGVNNRIAKVGGKANKVDIDLTEYYASVNVTCSLENAEIYIGSELKGTNKWNGVVPPGEITIEAKLKGYHPLVRTMMLNENDSIALNFSDFKKQSGSISINYKPDSCIVYIDANEMGVTPLVINEIDIGKHTLNVKKAYYVEHVESITIEEGQKLNISGRLSYKDAFSEIWVKAHEGEMESQFKLARCYLDDSFARYTDGWDRKNRDVSKAIFWLEKAAKQNHGGAMMELAYCYFNGTGCNRNYEKSLYWIKKCVAIKMDSNSCRLMGFHYRYGLGGVPKDYKQAAYWFRMAILSDPTGDRQSEKELKEIGYESQIPSKNDVQ